jgi:hypothetical protein
VVLDHKLWQFGSVIQFEAAMPNKRITALVLASALSACAAGSSEGQDFQTVGNSTAAVYQQNCEPGYTLKLGNGSADQSLVDNYQQVLRVKYRSDCQSFALKEVAPYVWIDAMAARHPEFLRPGAASLSEKEVAVLGYRAWLLDNYAQAGCPIDTFFGPFYETKVTPMFERIVQADAMGIAHAYFDAEYLIRVQNGLSKDAQGELVCAIFYSVLDALRVNLITMQLLSQDEENAQNQARQASAPNSQY